MSIIGQWLASDIIKEGIKQVAEYSKTLPASTRQFAPLLYVLVGAKTLQLTVDTATKGKEAFNAVSSNLRLVGCKSQMLLYRSIFVSALTMDKMEISLKVVSKEEFKKIVDSTEFFTENSQIVVNLLPLEFCILPEFVPSTIKLLFGSTQGTYPAYLHCSPEQFKKREVQISVTPNKSTPISWITLKF